MLHALLATKKTEFQFFWIPDGHKVPSQFGVFHCLCKGALFCDIEARARAGAREGAALRRSNNHLRCISFTRGLCNSAVHTSASSIRFHNFAHGPLPSLWTLAAAQAAPLAAAGTLARGPEEAFCSGLSQGVQGLSQSRRLHFAWHRCGRRGAELLTFNTYMSTPAGT